MSYDITLNDPVTNETIIFDNKHNIKGGTYCLGGTQEAWLNITWNYGKIFRKVLGEKGIRSIYGKSGAESIPMLKEAISKLKDDVSEDYWEATEGNVKKALYGLLAFAEMRPNGIWGGD